VGAGVAKAVAGAGVAKAVAGAGVAKAVAGAGVDIGAAGSDSEVHPAIPTAAIKSSPVMKKISTLFISEALRKIGR
jgi:hypothetical protein